MKLRLMTAALSLGLLAAASAGAAATVGQPAPAFRAIDTQGKPVQLSDFRGKHVVLEWVNPGCPFVRKHYSGNMQATQQSAVDRGVVWLTISSTEPASADYKKPADLGAWMTSQKARATATLMDDDGKVGRAYAARTTPHMYVIDPQGTLVYAGAIDSRPTARVSDIEGATNYVRQALDELLAGKPVSTPVTQAYGCSIKYMNAG